MRVIGFGAVSALALAFASPAFAQPQPSAGNLEKLGNFQQTGTADMAHIPQTGPKAEAIKRTLAKIKLPRGFKIGLYALVPDARHIAVGPQGIVTFVGTRKSKVWSVTDRAKARVADEVKEFAPSIDFKIPNGVCFSKDGFLFIAEQNRVLVFPAAEFFYEGPDVAAFQVVKQGELIPPEEESYNHTARTCRIGPDDKLYITLGQPFNVFAPEKMELYKKTGIGGMVRMSPRRQGSRGVRLGHPQFRRHGHQSEGQDACGSPTTRWTAWATTFRRANSTAPTSRA